MLCQPSDLPYRVGHTSQGHFQVYIATCFNNAGVAEYVVEEKGEQEQVQHDQEHEEPPSGYAYDADHQHFGGDELPQLGEVDPGVGDDQVPDGWVDGSNDAVEIDGMIDEQAGVSVFWLQI